MKKLMIFLAVLVAMLMVTEVASAQNYRAARGGFGSGACRVTTRTYSYRRSSGYYGGGGGFGFGGGRHAGRVDPPVTITQWNDDSLLSFGAQKFVELSGISDEEADKLTIAIKEKDYQTTKGVRVIEEVKFLARWTVVNKDQSGKEEKIPMSRVFELKFDDYGSWEKYKD